jgi:hypothetical protein
VKMSVRGILFDAGDTLYAPIGSNRTLDSILKRCPATNLCQSISKALLPQMYLDPPVTGDHILSL